MIFNTLIIQIPCFNEAETLAETVAVIPRAIAPFQRIEILVVDDGSTDNTVEVARAAGVDHILSLPHNKGLAAAFSAGISYALQLGADVIINTDGDNQYVAQDMGALLVPIIAEEAMIVIGTRPIEQMDNFSFAKKKLQKLGSWVVRLASGTRVIDATSGFRAIRRDAAQRIMIHSRFSYTVEMIMQAGFKRMPIACVPIRVNAVHRPSRLMRNIAEYILRQVLTIIQVLILYKPLKLFLPLSALMYVSGVFLYMGVGVQAGVVATLLCVFAAIVIIIGCFFEVRAGQRRQNDALNDDGKRQ